jgi:tetratricopeptide (TPR) repeat protein
MYIKVRLHHQNREQGSVFKPVLFYCASLLSAVLAMKTKEIAFTLPVVIVLFEFMFLNGKFWKKILSVTPLVLTMALIPLSLMGTDRPLGDVISDVSDVTRVQTTVSRLDYLYTECRVIITYLRLIVLPFHQNLDYDYPLFHSFFDREVLLSFLALLSLFGLSIFLWYRSRRSDTPGRLISFGILWFFITLSVESSIIPIEDVIFEHRMYLPSMGVFLVISSVFFMVKETGKHTQRAVIAVAVAIIMVFAAITYARNIVWSDELSLWKDVVSKSPKKDRGYINLGDAYQSQKFIDKAIEQYQIALKLNPYNPKSYNNLGVAYKSQKLYNRAIEQYRIAIQLDPDYTKFYNNLGVAYQAQGLVDNAIEQYQIAIERMPYNPEFYNNLGIAYKSQKLYNRAIEQYRTAIQLDPDYTESYNNLGMAYQAQGLIDTAIQQYRIAIKRDHDNAEAYNNLGTAYKAQGLIDKAIEQYELAINSDPDNPAFYINLGFAYQYKGFTDRAIEQYRIAIRLDPKNAEARKNLRFALSLKSFLQRRQ